MLDILKNTFGSRGLLKAWSLYLISFPFYVFPAGSVQPSDLFIFIVISLYILSNGFEMYSDNRKVFRKFLRFCLYVAIVNLGVYLVLLGQQNKGLPWFVFSAFYFYNLFVMGFSLVLYKRYGRAFLYTTIYSCIFSAVLQIGLSLIFETSGEGARGSLFFTNPNQLGYYSLCSLAIVLVLESMLKIPKIVVYGSFLLFTYMAVVSVSKAALGALIILFGIYLIANGILSVRNILVLLIVGGIGVFTLLNTQFGSNFQKNLELREQNEADRPNTVSEWQYRGYDRITNHPSYLILGAGEGGYNRFDTYIEGHEMHSSIGTIIFCYGIPGTILFLMFVFSLLRKLPWYYFIYAIPLFAYGITHMGLRFSIFWVALMMFPIIRMEIKKRNFFDQKKKT